MIPEVALLVKQGRVVAFCGSGLSAESGIPTFRGKDGLWEKYDPSLYVNVEGLKSLFFSTPEKLKDFIVDCYAIMLNAKPNRAYYGLYNLEKKGYLIGTITQNIDDFCSQVGLSTFCEIHGNAYCLRCPRCNFLLKKPKSDWQEFINTLKPLISRNRIRKVILDFMGRCPQCNEALESAVVFFGQSLLQGELEKSYAYLDKAKTLLCIGTSGVVYPAASLPLYAKEKKAIVVNVNPADSAIDAICDISIRQTADTFFEKLSLHL